MSPPSPLLGLGDRWLRGEAVAGVAFALHDRVRLVGGSRDGQGATVRLLLAVTPEPHYLVVLDGDDARELRVRQSSLGPAH